MQQDKNIQQKLQQLENQQLPDLSNMDDHWQKMQGMLQPTVPTPGKVVNISRWIYGIVGVAIITAGILLIANKKDNAENKIGVEQITQKTISQKKDDQLKSKSAVPDSIIASLSVNAPKFHLNNTLNNSLNTSITLAHKTTTPNSLVAGKGTLSVTPVTNDSTTTLKATIPNRQAMLDKLLSELAKTAQEFTINNKRDTLLIGEEGSVLFIPAKSLGGGSNIKISLKEYYKESDIVLNKLSTTSNGQQLETGGMVHIEATENGKPIETLTPGSNIRLYLPDTSKISMKGMELFNGKVQNDRNINWIAQAQPINRLITITLVKVLDIRDQPFRVYEPDNKGIGYFAVSQDSKLSRKELKEILKKRYGYKKIRLRNEWKNNFINQSLLKDREVTEDMSIGDSIWIDAELAKKYNLKASDSVSANFYQNGIWSSIPWIGTVSFGDTNQVIFENINNMTNEEFKYNVRSRSALDSGLQVMQNRYNFNLTSLGWINCDRFLGRKDLIRYAVNLNDEAKNYYTVLVFDNIKSMMTGFLEGNKVVFNNVPLNEPVKVISIGIDKYGETIMTMKAARTSKDELDGLVFEPVSKDELTTSLSKIDK